MNVFNMKRAAIVFSVRERYVRQQAEVRERLQEEKAEMHWKYAQLKYTGTGQGRLDSSAKEDSEGERWGNGLDNSFAWPSAAESSSAHSLSLCCARQLAYIEPIRFHNEEPFI